MLSFRWSEVAGSSGTFATEAIMVSDPVPLWRPDVNRLVFWQRSLDLVEEADELRIPVALHVAADEPQYVTVP